MPNVEILTHGSVDKNQAFSVSEITFQIKELLETRFQSIWVKGELSNIRTPPSGHIYASLKDADAQIRVVMFRNSNARSGNGSAPWVWKEGAEVLVLGRVSVYAPQGSYQIIVSHIEEVGSGALQAQFEALKKKLHAQGWFDPAHKKKLPFLPSRIGVVTSPSGAAIRDILNVISRRFPHMPVDIYPAVVQGKEAPPTIISALQLAQKLNRVDVLIVGRGGGSIEDLWCFNDEAVAQTIYECTIPVVSAVGHEIDFTICDFVADVRAPTPSAAAELVVPSVEELLSKCRELLSLLKHHIMQILNFAKQKLDTLYHQLQHPKDKLATQKQKLELYLAKMVTECVQRLRVQKQLLAHFRQTLDILLPQHVTHARQIVEKLYASLLALDPRSVLSRGYALVTDSPTGMVLTSSKHAHPKDKLQITFSDGHIHVEVA